MQINPRYLCCGSVQTDFNSADLFGSATKLQMYSNNLKSQNFTDVSEKRMYIISRSLSVQEFTL